ncbi:MAG: hypothetical protein AABW85_00670 [archaeon]
MSEETVKAKSGKSLFTIGLILVVLVLGGFIIFQNFFSPQKNQTTTGLTIIDNNLAPEAKMTTNVSSIENLPLESDVIDPTQFPVREQYFKEVFRPKRDTYKLFEKAALFLKKDISLVPAYFSLKNEEEIFSSLDKSAENFSEIAYLFANGQYFTIGLLGPEFYKQPELYPNFKTIGLRYFTKPDPTSWVTNGYGTYPSLQYDSLEKGKREEFSGVVFFYTAWGVQTFQGVTISPSAESQKYFDIAISIDDGEKVINDESFLLEPVFPRFYKNWAYKIVIKGKLKPNTPPGDYSVNFNVEIPPQELQSKWQFEHKNLYSNAAQAIQPSGSPIEFKIQVK